MLCRATQDGQVIVKSSDKTWFTGGGKGKPLQYSFLGNPMDRVAWQATVHRTAKESDMTSGKTRTNLIYYKFI